MTKLDRIEEKLDRYALESFEDAEKEAARRTEETGDLHVACDRSEYVWPRYSVVRAPQVGDEVSYGFNGDTYPDGVIVKVSKTLKKVTTDSGRTYYRRRKTGSWVSGGTWSLVAGHISTYNRSF